MPLSNRGVTTITTYNDVAGDQNFITNIYSSALPTTVPAFPSRLLPVDIEFPIGEPYATLSRGLFEAHQAFAPIPLTLSGNAFLRTMGTVLEHVLTTTCLAGRLIDTLGSHRFFRISLYFWISKVSLKLEGWSEQLQLFVEEVRRYKHGLEFTLIGPIWRRVIWSVMFSLSADMNIERILRTAMEHIDKFKVHLEQLLVSFSENNADQHCWDVMKAIKASPLLQKVQHHVSISRFAFPMILIRYTQYQKVAIPPPFFVAIQRAGLSRLSRGLCVETSSHTIIDHTLTDKITNTNRQICLDMSESESILTSHPINSCLSCSTTKPLEHCDVAYGWEQCPDCRALYRVRPYFEPSPMSIMLHVPSPSSKPIHVIRTVFTLDHLEKVLWLYSTADMPTFELLVSYLSSIKSQIQGIDNTLAVTRSNRQNIVLEPPLLSIPSIQPIILKSLQSLTIRHDGIEPLFEWEVSLPALLTLTLIGAFKPTAKCDCVPAWITGCRQLEHLKLCNSPWFPPPLIFTTLPNLQSVLLEDFPLNPTDLDELCLSVQDAKLDGHPLRLVGIRLCGSYFKCSLTWFEGMAKQWRLSSRFDMDFHIRPRPSFHQKDDMYLRV